MESNKWLLLILASVLVVGIIVSLQFSAVQTVLYTAVSADNPSAAKKQLEHIENEANEYNRALDDVQRQTEEALKRLPKSYCFGLVQKKCISSVIPRVLEPIFPLLRRVSLKQTVV